MGGRGDDALWALLERRAAVLDGGLGTLVQAMGVGRDAFAVGSTVLEGDTDVLNLTRPKVVAQCHRLMHFAHLMLSLFLAPSALCSCLAATAPARWAA